MSVSPSTDASVANNRVPFNWPVVGFLMFMTGIPAIPAFFLIAIVLAGPSAIEGVASIVNQLHFKAPAAILVHGGSGIIFFLTMPFQFSTRLRQQCLRWHKNAGRLALLSGVVMALSGIWMHHVLFPGEYGMRYFSLITMSLAICGGFCMALMLVLRGNIIGHRKWMMRAVALSLAAVTPLFTETLLWLIFGQFQSAYTILSQLHYDYGRLLGMAINLAVVELMLRSGSARTVRLRPNSA